MDQTTLAIMAGFFLMMTVAGYMATFGRKSKATTTMAGVQAASYSARPATKEERWEVKFAGRWYNCQPVSADRAMGLGIVQLTDPRTHSRPITRPLSEIIRRV